MREVLPPMKCPSRVSEIRSPRRASRKAAQCGFTLVEIMVVIFILGVLLNMAMPTFIHARDSGQARACVSNLTRIAGAKEEYALDNHIPMDSSHIVTWSDLSSYIRGPQPTCPTHSPDGYNYNLNSIGVAPTCPYGAPASDPSLVHQYIY